MEDAAPLDKGLGKKKKDKRKPEAVVGEPPTELEAVLKESAKQ